MKLIDYVGQMVFTIPIQQLLRRGIAQRHQ
jgi:hypothetical protein